MTIEKVVLAAFIIWGLSVAYASFVGIDDQDIPAITAHIK